MRRTATDFPGARKATTALADELARIPAESAEKPAWFILDLIESLSATLDTNRRVEMFEALKAGIEEHQRSFPPMLPSEGAQKDHHTAALEELRGALRRPRPPVPEAELDTLCKVALGDTGQSRTCRYLLCLLAGSTQDPTGFVGEGLLEMRTLDRNLADSFLKVLDWWRGPTRSDAPLYAVLHKIEKAFVPSVSK